MPDASYQPKVYKQQGGNVMVVASGGNILVEAGGSITQPVVTETTATALANFGVSVVTRGTTATGSNAYSMAAPIAGTIKHIVALAATVSEHILIQGNTNVTYDPAGTKDKLKIVAPGLVTLVGLSTSAWGVVGLSTAVVSLNS